MLWNVELGLFKFCSAYFWTEIWQRKQTLGCITNYLHERAFLNGRNLHQPTQRVQRKTSHHTWNTRVWSCRARQACLSSCNAGMSDILQMQSTLSWWQSPIASWLTLTLKLTIFFWLKWKALEHTNSDTERYRLFRRYLHGPRAAFHKLSFP